MLTSAIRCRMVKCQCSVCLISSCVLFAATGDWLSFLVVFASLTLCSVYVVRIADLECDSRLLDVAHMSDSELISSLTSDQQDEDLKEAA